MPEKHGTEDLNSPWRRDAKNRCCFIIKQFLRYHIITSVNKNLLQFFDRSIRFWQCSRAVVAVIARCLILYKYEYPTFLSCRIRAAGHNSAFVIHSMPRATVRSHGMIVTFRCADPEKVDTCRPRCTTDICAVFICSCQVVNSHGSRRVPYSRSYGNTWLPCKPVLSRFGKSQS